MREVIIDVENFKKGFYKLDDTTKAPFGSLRIMKNAQVTNRGGLSQRPGTTLIGTNNTSDGKIRGFYTYKKSFDQEEFLIKCYNDKLEAYSKNISSVGWFLVKDGITSGKEFGFTTSLVNINNQDYLIGCNRYDPYFRWTGAITQLNGDLSAGSLAVKVDSTLTNEAFVTETGTSSTATTITVSSAKWANDQWINFYIYITSGDKEGEVRLITDNDTTSITFTTLGVAPGNVSFEVRQLAFPQSGTIIYNDTEIDYTDISKSTEFTVVSTHAGSDNGIVSLKTDEYPANPKGDRITNHLNRIFIGNVRSAMARDSGGALSGYSSGGSVFVSKLNDPFDFGFSASRIAGEGDIISMPYGGGEITDVVTQEDAAYVFKEDYIEKIAHSQDSNDLVLRTPLKSGVGSVGKVIKGSDDVYFITKDNRFTSLGRVRLKDLRPETENIGYPIQNYLKDAGIDSIGIGAEIENKIYIPLKSNTTITDNDSLLIYNKEGKGYFEGVWNLPVFGISEMNGDWYYSESNGPNVYKLFSESNADIIGDERYPINSEVATHFMNFTSSKSSLQAMSSFVVEGYIRAGTEITFNLWKDFSDIPFFTFIFNTNEDGLLDGEGSTAFLGSKPLSINALGASFSDVLSDGMRHFSFRIYFPFQYGNYFSVGHSVSGTDNAFEIIRYGLGIKEDTAVKISRIKNI